MKKIAIKVVDSQLEALDVNIKPGTTAGEILTQLNLEGYVLLPLPKPEQFSHLGESPVLAKTVSMLRSVINFKDDEDLYPELMDEDRLLAIGSPQAEAYIRQIVYGSSLRSKPTHD